MAACFPTRWHSPHLSTKICFTSAYVVTPLALVPPAPPALLPPVPPALPPAPPLAPPEPPAGVPLPAVPPLPPVPPVGMLLLLLSSPPQPWTVAKARPRHTALIPRYDSRSRIG